MESRSRQSGSTRKRLLNSACEVFAEKGYRDATIAEISERAGANIAAVNYHFGNKESLYAEAWRHSFHMSLGLHPPDGGVREDASPEERLRARLLALLRRIVDERCREFSITSTELANPTGLLQEVMREAIQPLRKKMTGLVRELLGPHASDTDVLFCQVSTLSQCIDVMTRQRLIRQIGRHGPPPIRDIDAYAEHVATFSLAGIRLVRERAERKAKGDGGGRGSRK